MRRHPRVIRRLAGRSRLLIFAGLGASRSYVDHREKERVRDSVSKRRAAGLDLGGRRRSFTERQIKSATQLFETGQPATHVARDLGMSRATLYPWIRELLRPETAAPPGGFR
ncbi:hypothetical protein E3O19_05435 [Cryobacterium algoritolerans]|uniref:Resolvase HTH domain-containing protein n=1 Tax=Cryobacterium algoritolerans TaxID=1259184 RepID=A0A4R8WXZ5_9MICO|nr:hypothetical protein E3O19_05435 [Cryobacterium algoritolerans]